MSIGVYGCIVRIASKTIGHALPRTAMCLVHVISKRISSKTRPTRQEGKYRVLQQLFPGTEHYI